MAEPPRLTLRSRPAPKRTGAPDLGVQDWYLTVPQAAERLRQLGPAFASVTESRVRGLADRGVLPFFRPPGFKARVISENELLAFWRRHQLEASKECRNRR